MLLTAHEIRVQRVKMGIKQKDFATIIGRSKNAFNRFENGKSSSYEIRVKATEVILSGRINEIRESKKIN